MKKRKFNILLACTLLVNGIFLLGNGSFLFGQIIDFKSERPYKKVFVETDDFGAFYLEQLEEAFPKAEPNSLKFSILNDLAYYWHTRNLDKAMEFTREGLRLTLKKKDTLWQGRFQITQGAILLRMEKLDSAEHVLEKAKLKVIQKDLAHLNTQLGYVYERRGQLDKATYFAFEVLRLGEKLNDKKAIAMAYSDLSNLLWKQSKFDLALEYGLKSLALFEKRGIHDMDYDFTLYVTGNNYLALKEYKKALLHYEHAVEIGERYGFFNNLSDIYISLVDLYAYLGEFKKAEAASTSALKYADLLSNNFLKMRSWLSVGKLQNLEQKYDLAQKSLISCIQIATKDFGDDYFLSQAYEALGKAYIGNHQYKEAYLAFTKYDLHKNAIFTAESHQRISKLHTELDVAKKEGTILQQETQIKKQRVQQNFVIIITVLLLLLLLLTYKFLQKNIKINDLLRNQNEEKEFLLKEVHHRVKNNLEIISSLLALQSSQIEDQNVLNVMEASQHRIHSIGMIHKKLYAGENLAAIEMKDYFSHLADYIVDAFGMQNQVDIAVNMKELELDVDIAIPIGLIVNELLVNSLKYAFPDNRRGKIHISLKQTGTLVQLDVKDDGIGHKKENKAIETGFGTRLIKLLTKQLEGKMLLNIDQGTHVSIKFKCNKAA